MAHTDACKYQVCQLLEKCVQHGMSVNEASKRVQDESDGIPAKTIQRWWREIKEGTAALLKNEQQTEQPTNQEVKVETVETFDPPKTKMTKEEVVVEIDIMVDQGMSIREASKVLARKLGRSIHGVRRTYCKVKEEQNNKCHATFAWQFAEIAIMQLSRINKDDPDRTAAYARVKDWISKQEEN